MILRASTNSKSKWKILGCLGEWGYKCVRFSVTEFDMKLGFWFGFGIVNCSNLNGYEYDNQMDFLWSSKWQIWSGAC